MAQAERRHTANQSTTSTPQLVFMFSPLDFPPLEETTNLSVGIKSSPYVKAATPTQAEAVLNWQTQNAVAQNTCLQRIEKKVDSVSQKTKQSNTQVQTVSVEIQELQSRLRTHIESLHNDLMIMLQMQTFCPDFNKKEAEIRRLKAQFVEIEDDLARRSRQ